MKRRKLAKPTDKCAMCRLTRKQHRGLGHYFIKVAKRTENDGLGE